MAEPAAVPPGRAPAAAHLRGLFLLDPSFCYLNHGSFGACPRPVFETYQRLQRELERQPMDFLSRRYDERLDEARATVADLVHADLDGLVLLANTTAAVNTVARSLHLRPGDEILATDHEYAACVLAWRAAARAGAAEVVVAQLPEPLTEPAGVLAALDAARTDRTRVVFVSHLASVTSVLLPVREICGWARRHGLLSVVDGAHVPGQLPLDITAVGADAYIGNCHKWLCGPKATAFLRVALGCGTSSNRSSCPGAVSPDPRSPAATPGAAPTIRPRHLPCPPRSPSRTGTAGRRCATGERPSRSASRTSSSPATASGHCTRADRTGIGRWSPCRCRCLPAGPPRSSARSWIGGGSRCTSGRGARTP